jgi:hypothetical protein
MLHPLLEDAFDDLLVAWRHHQERRATAMDTASLAVSRAALDEVRDRVRRLRTALHPEHHEVEEAAFAVTCPSLDTAVVVYPRDVTLDAGVATYTCVCGRREVSVPA